MLIDFFYTLRAAKLAVPVKEFLTLLEAFKHSVAGAKTSPTDCVDCVLGAPCGTWTNEF